MMNAKENPEDIWNWDENSTNLCFVFTYCKDVMNDIMVELDRRNLGFDDVCARRKEHGIELALR